VSFYEDLLIYAVLALGAAMAVGNTLALIRPPAEGRADGDLDRAPVARSLLFIVIGAVAAVWSLASIIG
jgi:hypothetical protein